MIKESELILTKDERIYHINLKREDLAQNVILVGDPDRVEVVSNFFDKIDFKTQHREFVSHTGYYKNTRFTVLSTGIGPDNIDIALNELDAVANIDFQSREERAEKTKLNIVRLGTSGSVQEDIPVDSIVLSSYGLGMDNMIHSYRKSKQVREKDMEDAFLKHTMWNMEKGTPYIVSCGWSLRDRIISKDIFEGITGTAPGFYAPQGRKLRLEVDDENINEKLSSFEYKNYRITNLEMETSAIYGLSKMLGHNAVSINAIIANRKSKTFSGNTKKTIENMIGYALDKLS